MTTRPLPVVVAARRRRARLRGRHNARGEVKARERSTGRKTRERQHLAGDQLHRDVHVSACATGIKARA